MSASVQNPLILSTTWWGKYYQYLDLTSEKKKVQRGQVTFLEIAQLKVSEPELWTQI